LLKIINISTVRHYQVEIDHRNWSQSYAINCLRFVQLLGSLRSSKKFFLKILKEF